MRTSITFAPIKGTTQIKEVDTILGTMVVGVFESPAPEVKGSKKAAPLKFGIMALKGSPAATTLTEMADPAKAHHFDKNMGLANGFGEAVRLDLLQKDPTDPAEKAYVAAAEAVLSTDPIEGPVKGGIASFLVYVNYLDIVKRSSVAARAVVASDGSLFLPEWEDFKKKDKPKLSSTGKRLSLLRPTMKSFLNPEVQSRRVRIWADNDDVQEILDTFDGPRIIAAEGQLVDIPWGDNLDMDGLQIKLSFALPTQQGKTQPQALSLEDQVANADDGDDDDDAAAAFGTNAARPLSDF